MRAARLVSALVVLVPAVLMPMLIPGAAAAQAPAASDPAAAPAAVDMTWGVKIPLRDGVELNATVYRPAGQREPLPVIFTLTPYVGDSYHDRAMYMAARGYVFALVDVRGRGNSQGSFEPFVNEGRDGYDVVEFLARQPWSNGKVGMWGGSYAGFDQWATLKEEPPHLATIVPAAAVYPGIDFPFTANIFFAYDMQWITFTSGAPVNEKLFGDDEFWSAKFGELYRAEAPFSTLDRVVGNPSAVFQKWLAHPTPDAYWQAMEPTAAQYAAMQVPILTITGAYDADQPGALTYYREFMQHAAAAERARMYLVVGPWNHAGTRTPNRRVGGLDFGEASLVDLNRLHREWYDWTLKGGSRPEFLRQHVAYYVVGPGADRWRYGENFAAIAGESRALYLGASAGGAGDAFHSGTLAAAPPPPAAAAAGVGGAPDRYVYDPRDLRHGAIEQALGANFNTDQSPALNLYGDGVVYHSEPFAESTEISGAVKLAVWLSLDVPDTDLGATLYEILPDGSSVLLTADLLRARYRHSLLHEEPVPPGAVERYTFEHFPWFSRQVSRGSRLRLVIDSPNSMQLEKNHNSGKPVAGESGADARVAHVAVYHDAAHPSALELPIVR